MSSQRNRLTACVCCPLTPLRAFLLRFLEDKHRKGNCSKPLRIAPAFCSERKFVDAVPMYYGRGAAGGKKCKDMCVMSVDTCTIPRQAT
jgi:hypothetical protein